MHYVAGNVVRNKTVDFQIKIISLTATLFVTMFVQTEYDAIIARKRIVCWPTYHPISQLWIISAVVCWEHTLEIKSHYIYVSTAISCME